MKHASALAANPDINEDQAKIIYKSLRKASGLFKFVQEKYFDKLQDQPLKGFFYKFINDSTDFNNPFLFFCSIKKVRI